MGKTGLSMKNMNKNYKYIIPSFVLNTVLHYVGMSWIIETNQHFEYDLDKNNPDWKIGCPWYNTYICKKIHGKVFDEFIRNAKTDRYNIICSIDKHKKR